MMEWNEKGVKWNKMVGGIKFIFNKIELNGLKGLGTRDGRWN